MLAVMNIHGVVDRSTLLADGVSAAHIQRQVRSQQWTRPRRGVYVVGAADVARPWLQDMAIDVVAAGPSALLSHRSASFLYGLDESSSHWRELTVPFGSGARGPNVHRTVHLLHASSVHGLPVVSVQVCLAQLGVVVDVDGVEIALESALRKGIVTEDALRARVGSGLSRVNGAVGLVAALDRRPPGIVPTGSFLETRFVQVSRRAGLPEFERQVEIRRSDGRLIGKVDFAFRPTRLAVECDGVEFHGNEQIDADNARQNAMELAGWHFARFTYRQIMHDPDYVIRTLRAWMARAA